jgi:two-component system sensor histidine kinase/response regulator
MSGDHTISSKGTILIVDDSNADLNNLAGILIKGGYTVRLSPSGESALKFVRFTIPDLILLDTHMPGMDGYEVCRRFKNNERTTEIPVIFISEEGGVEDKDKGYEVGGIDFITKPFRADEVLVCVGAHLSTGDFQQLFGGVEKRFRNILDSVPYGMVLVDEGGDIVIANKHIESMLGYSPEELKGRKIELLLPGRYHQVHRQFCRGYFVNPKERKMGIDLEIYAAHKDGHEIPVEIHLSVIRMEEGVLAQVVIRDNTERKQLEKTLRESKEWHRALVESSSHHIFTLGRNGNYLTSNHRVKQFGLEKSESLVGRHLWEVYPPELAMFYKQQVEEVFETGRVVNFEHIMSEPDGYHYHLDTLYPLRREGEVVAVGGMCRDITKRKTAESSVRTLNAEIEERIRLRTVELKKSLLDLQKENTIRKRAEGELREREERYRIFAKLKSNFAFSAFVETDGGLIHEWASEEFSRSTGYTSEEFESEGGWRNLIHPEDMHIFIGLLSSLFSKRSDSIEFRIIRKDGGERVLRYYAQPQWNPVQKRVVRIVGAAQDITDLKDAEEELNEMAAFFHTHPAPLLLASVDGDIISANPFVVDLFGRDVTGESALTLFSEMDESILDQASDDPIQFEQEIAGRVFLFKVTQHEETHSLYIYGSDITAMKQVAEELVKANEAAERAKRTKGEFLGNVSHEISTQVNAILGFSQLMLRDPALTLKQKESLDAIITSGEHLDGLVNDVLKKSKIESDRTTLNLTPFNPHILLDNIEKIFKIRANAKGLSLRVEVMGDLPEVLVGDVGKLRHVFINLLGNAVKYTTKGGILLKVIPKEEDPDYVRLRVEVKDTGAGISETELDKLFHPLNQTGVRINHRDGNGLGLSISRAHVRLMGGDITVTSKEGKGSVFKFDVRLEKGDSGGLGELAPQHTVTGLKPGQPTYRILVAEDMDTSRDLFSKALTSVGFEVREASNGQEVLQALSGWQPDLILLDMDMPIMGGNETIERVKASTEGGFTVVIAVTEGKFSDDQRDVILSGADDVLNKPFTLGKLYQVIGTQLGVDYIYSDAEISDTQPVKLTELVMPTHDAIAGFPRNLVDQMREATESGRINRLNELIDRAVKYDPQVAQGLRALADRYDYDTLADLLKDGNRN